MCHVCCSSFLCWRALRRSSMMRGRQSRAVTLPDHFEGRYYSYQKEGINSRQSARNSRIASVTPRPVCLVEASSLPPANLALHTPTGIGYQLMLMELPGLGNMGRVSSRERIDIARGVAKNSLRIFPLFCKTALSAERRSSRLLRYFAENEFCRVLHVRKNRHVHTVPYVK